MEITKLRSQLFIMLEQVSPSLERARNTLGRLGTGVADTLQEARRSSESALRKLQASFLAAVVFTNGKITKLRPQLAFASQRASAQVESALGRAGRGVADGLLEALRSTRNALSRLQTSFLAAAVFTNGKITKLRPQLAAASERAAAQVESAQSALGRAGRGIANGLLEALRSIRNALRKVYLGFLEAIFAVKRAIANCGSKLLAALKQVAAPFQRAYRAISGATRSVIERPRRLEEARLARENDLQTLLANSADAIIVTNSERRLVAANPQALDIFGVSELNMSNFTIGTFVSQRQILDFDRNSSPFIGLEERHGKCKIRRLDGSVWIAECIFVANVVPRRNLYRFVNVAPQKITQWKSPASYTESTGKPFDVGSQHHKAS